MRPGASVRDYRAQPAFRDTVKQLGGNITLGMSFGMLLPVLAPRARGLVRIVAVTASVMTLVELVQGSPIAGRAFDTDDVVLNTTGAFVGLSAVC
ncbi:VanZ family protein [Streptomyces sp. NPDC058620]|uniref:VanZ family protein n=1 Tax=Streptomyces sp. NPDC058620 TaxID=3346560 RepID=UPI003656617B